MSKIGSICHYLILAIDNQWWVDREGKPYGPCASQEEAVAAAMRLIDLLEDQGRRADIWAPDDSGKARRVWQRPSAQDRSTAPDGLSGPRHDHAEPGSGAQGQ